jgi:hypothetical protein
LPIQINFINIYQRNIQEGDLDTLKLKETLQKYNEHTAGWKQMQLHFLQRKSLPE